MVGQASRNHCTTHSRKLVCSLRSLPSNLQRVLPWAGRFRFLPKFLFLHYLLLKLCMFLLPGPKALDREQ